MFEAVKSIIVHTHINWYLILVIIMSLIVFLHLLQLLMFSSFSFLDLGVPYSLIFPTYGRSYTQLN